VEDVEGVVRAKARGEGGLVGREEEGDEEGDGGTLEGERIIRVDTEEGEPAKKRERKQESKRE
jgi:hypothetical protein